MKKGTNGIGRSYRRLVSYFGDNSVIKIFAMKATGKLTFEMMVGNGMVIRDFEWLSYFLF